MQITAVVTFGLALAASWAAGDGDTSLRDGETTAPEPLFQRLVISPGDDASALPLTTPQAQLIEIDRTGAMLVHIGTQVRRQLQPRAYQDIDGRRRHVLVRFDIAAAGDARLVVGPYDQSVPLVIEPQPWDHFQP